MLNHTSSFSRKRVKNQSNGISNNISHFLASEGGIHRQCLVDIFPFKHGLTTFRSLSLDEERRN
jgi:hypothetical protein